MLLLLFAFPALAEDAVNPPTLIIPSTTFQVGDTLHLHGEMGDATTLGLQLNPSSDAGSYSGSPYLDVTFDIQDGSWSCDIPLDTPGCFRVNLTGDPNTDHSVWAAGCYIFVGSSMAPAPQVLLVPEQSTLKTNYTLAFHVVSQSADFNAYSYTLVSHGGTSSYSRIFLDTMDPEGDAYGFDFYTSVNYADTYTMEVVLFRLEDDQITAFSSCGISEPFEVTGKHRPIYGPVPLEASLPDVLPAGQDFSVSWQGPAADQTLRGDLVRLKDTGDDYIYSFYNIALGKSPVIPGYLLDAGCSYELRLVSQADYYENGALTLPFSILENSDLLPAPSVTVPNEICNGQSLMLTLGESYDLAAYRLVGPDGQESTYTSAPHGRSLPVSIGYSWNPREEDEGEWTISLSGCRDGRWSPFTEPVTFSVVPWPEVEELTVLCKDTMDLGEDFIFSIISPEENGYVNLTVTDSTGHDTGWGWGTYPSRASLTVSAASMLHFCTMPGDYLFTFSWRLSDDRELTLERTIHITGTAFEPMTLDPLPEEIPAGTPIHLTGHAGSAKRLELSGYGPDRMSYTDSISVLEDGTFSYELPTSLAGVYQVSLLGYTADGLCTGSDDAEASVFDASTPVAPAVSFSTSSPKAWEYLELSFTTPDDFTANHWEYIITDERGRVQEHSSHVGYSTCSFYPRYGGEYTARVRYYVWDLNTYSRFAEVTFSVDGPAQPEHGPVEYTLDLPDTVMAGCNVSWPIETTVESASFSFQLHFVRPDGSDFWYDQNPCSDITIPGYFLQEDTTCTLFVNASADNWEEASSTHRFSVLANPAQTEGPVVLSMAPSPMYSHDQVTFQFDRTYDELYCEVNPSDRNQRRYMTERLSGADSWTPEDTAVYRNLSENWTLSVFGLTDGVWSQEGSYSFEVLDHPYLDEPVFITFPESVDLFSSFDVAIQPNEHAESYRFYIERLDPDGWTHWAGGTDNLSEPSTTFTSWSQNAVSGTYVLWAEARADGYNSSFSYIEFTVNDIELPPAPSISISPAAPTSGEPISADFGSVYDELRIRVYQNGEQVNSYYATMRSDLPGIRLSAGSYTIRGQYRAGNIWSAESEPVEVTVTQAPVLDVPAFVIAPDTVDLFSTFEVAVEPVEHAKEYFFALIRVDGDRRYYMGSTSNGTPSMQYDMWSDDAIPGTYEMQVEIMADGYESSYATYTLTVRDAVRPESPDISIAQTGITTAENVVVTFDQVYEQIKVIVRKDGSTYRSYINDNSNSISFISLPAGSYTVSGMAKVNNIWSEESNEIPVTVTQAPVLPAPVLLSYPTSVPLFSPIEVSVEPVDGAIYEASLYVRQPNGDYTFVNGWSWDFTPFAFEAWPADAVPGEYRMTIWIEKPGYESSSTFFDFTAEEVDRAPAPEVTVRDTEITSAEYLHVQFEKVYETIRVTVYQNGFAWGNFGSDDTDLINWIQLSPGDYTITCTYLSDGIWSEESEPVAIHVTQGPELDAPVVKNWPQTLQVGESFTLDFDAVEHATEYYLSVAMVPWKYVGQIYSSTNSITFSDWPDDATPGTYRLQLSAYGEGFDSRNAVTTAVLEVSDGARPEKPTFRLLSPDGTVTTSIDPSVTYSLECTPYENDTVTGIRWRYGNEETYMDSDARLIEPTEGTIKIASCFKEWREEGETNVSVSVCVNGVWSVYSTPITYPIVSSLPVEFTSVLTLPQGVKTIEEEAFSGVPAEKIVLPQGCTTIESMAFANCRKLRYVVIPASVTSIADNAFEGCRGDLVIETPAGSIGEQFAQDHGLTVIHP